MSVKVAFQDREGSFSKKLIDIFIDDELFKTVDQYLFKSKFSKNFEAASFLEFKKLFFELELKVARGFALKCLARRNLHSEELKAKMRDKLFSDSAIQETIKECEQSGFIKDTDFLEAFVKKLKRQGKSSRAIQQKLYALGIREKVVDDNHDSLKILLSKKFPELLDRKTPFELKQKAIGKLYRRGFSIQEINSVLKDF